MVWRGWRWPADTSRQRQSARQTVTGIVVNERPGVPRQVRRRMRAILHRARAEGLPFVSVGAAGGKLQPRDQAIVFGGHQQQMGRRRRGIWMHRKLSVGVECHQMY